MKTAVKVVCLLAGMLVVFAIGIFVVGASTNTAPPSSPVEDMAEMKRVIAENYLIRMQIQCLPEPLSQSQQDYLVASGSEHVAQTYLTGLISASGAGAHCLDRALRTCERKLPGQCVAVAGELHGKRP